MNQPEVTVIMAVFNSADYLDQSISSILGQSFTNFELIIVDDHSSDNSLAIIKKYQNTDSRVFVLKNERNQGVSSSRNRGINTARGRYIAILDSDDIALPDRLQTQFDYLENNPDTALVAGGVQIINGAGVITGKKIGPNDFEILKYRLLLKNPLVQSTLFFRTDILRKLGGYDSAFDYSEEFNLYSLLIRHNYKIASIPKVLCLYRHHDSSITTMNKTRQIQLEHAYQIAENNISQYLSISPKKIRRFIEIIYEQKLSLLSIPWALVIYLLLTKNYITKERLEKRGTKKIWRTCFEDEKNIIRRYLKSKLRSG